MSGPTITMCPTLANPEAIADVAELRRELGRANDNVLQLAGQLHNAQSGLRDVSEILARLVVAHRDGQHDYVKRALDAIIARHMPGDGGANGGLH